MIRKWLVRFYLYAEYYFQKITRTGSFGPDQAVYIKEAYKDTGNFVKDGLFRHHVKQYHEASCSVASTVSVVNTLLEKKGDLNGRPVGQHDLLEKVKTAHWKERMGPKGHKGKRGLPLSTLGEVVMGSLDAYGIYYHSIETVQALKHPKKSKKIKELLRTRLERFEKKGDCLIIAHFDQGSFLPDLHIPHISPVGGFEPKTGRVTLLDVDITQSHPYEISFETFYKGVSSDYNPMFRQYGFAEGGYIYIRLYNA